MRMARYLMSGAGLILLGLGGSPMVAAAPGGGVAAAESGPHHRSARVPADGSYGENGERQSRGLWQRAHPLTIQRGVLTVDGLTVKTGLSFRVADMKYMYVYVPGAGTTVIGERPFGGAMEQRAAFRGRTLTVTAGGSRLQLTAANRMRGSRPAYVRFDRGTVAGVLRPMVGFGSAALAPAVWESDGGDLWNGRRRVRVSGRRALRMAKLCRPSPHGREMCATIREVAYER